MSPTHEGREDRPTKGILLLLPPEQLQGEARHWNRTNKLDSF